MGRNVFGGPPGGPQWSRGNQRKPKGIVEDWGRRAMEIRRRLRGDVGPQQWQHGDPREHCSGCPKCGGFFRTRELSDHQQECWVTHAIGDLPDALNEIDRLTNALHVSEMLLAEVRAQRDALTAPAAEEF